MGKRNSKKRYQKSKETRKIQENDQFQQTPGEPADMGLIQPGVDEDRRPDESQRESIEVVTQNESVDEYRDEMAQYTEDPDIMEDFAERQQLNTGGNELLDQLQQHTSVSPELSGGDVDAAWTDADAAGEETVGGSTPTPDQDDVDEIGDALGVTFDREEPLHDKLTERDQHRWELNPDSEKDANQEEPSNPDEDDGVEDADEH